MIDRSQINDLRQTLGPADFDEVLSLFLEEAETALAQLATNPTGDSAAPLHFLKGSARTIGFTGLADLCEAGEQKGSADIPALRDCLNGSLASLKDDAQQLRSRTAPASHHW